MKPLPQIVFCVGLLSASNALAAPQSFYGKTLRVSWDETRSQRVAGETAFKPVSLPFVYSVYTSSKGQLFKRLSSTSASRRASGTKDRVGTSGSDSEGAGAVSFQGNTMIATMNNGGLEYASRSTADRRVAPKSSAAKLVRASHRRAATQPARRWNSNRCRPGRRLARFRTATRLRTSMNADKATSH